MTAIEPMIPHPPTMPSTAQLPMHINSTSYKAFQTMQALRDQFPNRDIRQNLSRLAERIGDLLGHEVTDGQAWSEMPESQDYLNDVITTLEKAARKTDAREAARIISELVEDANSITDPTQFINRIRRLCSGAEKDIWFKGDSLQKATHVFSSAKKATGILGHITMAWRRSLLRGEYALTQTMQAEGLHINKEHVSRHLAIKFSEAEPVRGEFALQSKKGEGSLKEILDSLYPKGIPNEFQDYNTDLLTYGSHTLQGFSDLQDLGFLHRDPKAGNILVYKTSEKKSYQTSTGMVAKVSDFGTAIKVGENDLDKYSCGNQRFIPPEGTASRKGEVASVAILLVGTLEAQFLPNMPTDMLVSPKHEKPGASGLLVPEQRGIDKFLSLNRDCPQTSRGGLPTLYGRVRAVVIRWGRAMFLPRPILMMQGPSAKAKDFHEQFKIYTAALITHMKKCKNFDTSKAVLDNLQELLNDMAGPIPEDRPSMKDALTRYINIVDQLNGNIPQSA